MKSHRSGLFSYLSENDKIVNHTLDGRINIISIEKGQFELPNLATPVPFQKNIFLLDCCCFSQARKVFVPVEQAFKIDEQGKARHIRGPILARAKCALVKN